MEWGKEAIIWGAQESVDVVPIETKHEKIL